MEQLNEWDYVYRTCKRGGGKWTTYNYHISPNCRKLLLRGVRIKKVRLGAALAAGYTLHNCLIKLETKVADIYSNRQ